MVFPCVKRKFRGRGRMILIYKRGVAGTRGRLGFREGLAGQQFGGTFADAFGVGAAEEAAVVEEELWERQVVGPQVAAEEYVVA